MYGICINKELLVGNDEQDVIDLANELIGGGVVVEGVPGPCYSIKELAERHIDERFFDDIHVYDIDNDRATPLNQLL